MMGITGFFSQVKIHPLRGGRVFGSDFTYRRRHISCHFLAVWWAKMYFMPQLLKPHRPVLFCDKVPLTSFSSQASCLRWIIFVCFPSSSDLRNQPYRRVDGGRRSGRWKPGQQLQVSSDISLWKTTVQTDHCSFTSTTYLTHHGDGLIALKHVDERRGGRACSKIPKEAKTQAKVNLTHISAALGPLTINFQLTVIWVIKC